MRIVMYGVALLLVLGGGAGLLGVATQLRFFSPTMAFQMLSMAVPVGLSALSLASGVRMLRNLRRVAEADDEHERAAAARSLRATTIVVCVLLGLAGLLASVCGGLFMGSQYGQGAGALVLAGLAVLVTALVLVIWASRWGRD